MKRVKKLPFEVWLFFIPFIFLCGIALFAPSVDAGFVGYLKQSTGVTISLGPFLDTTDGNTAETAITLEDTEIWVSKNGLALANPNETTNAVVDGALGYFMKAIDATDTATVGVLRIVAKDAAALIVDQTYTVLPANVYDSLIGGTDLLQADMTQIMGSGVTTASAQLGVNVVNIGGTAQTAGDVPGELANATYGLSALETLVDDLETRLTATRAAYLDLLNSGTTVANIAAGAITAASIANAAIDAATFAADVDAEFASYVWDAATASYGGAGSYGLLVETNIDGTIASRAPSSTALSTATWTATRAGYLDNLNSGVTASTVTDKTGYSLANPQTFALTGNITGNLSGSVGSVTGDVGGSVNTVLSGVTLQPDSITAAIIATDAIGASELASTAVAEIVSGITGAPLAAPTAGAPSTTPTLEQAISDIFTSWRNKSVTEASGVTTYADDGTTPIWKFTHSDDGTAYTKGEVGAP